MKSIQIYLALILYVFCYATYGQTETDEKKKPMHPNLISHFIEMRQLMEDDNIKHVDSISGYSIVIPLWWSIRESSHPNLFSGLFPRTKGIVNALAFKVYHKKRHFDLLDFENWIINDYENGESPKWSDKHELISKKEICDFSDIGKAYKVKLLFKGKTYVCCYIMVETSNSYLWIDFTATTETYELNFEKFKSLMENYKTI